MYPCNSGGKRTIRTLKLMFPKEDALPHRETVFLMAMRFGKTP